MIYIYRQEAWLRNPRARQSQTYNLHTAKEQSPLRSRLGEMSSSTCKRLHIGVVIFQWLLTLPSMSCRRIAASRCKASPPLLPPFLVKCGGKTRNKRTMDASFSSLTQQSCFIVFLFYFSFSCLFVSLIC